MDRHMILYRGSLKSCNYHCSYCPFSKHPMSARVLEKDREQWFSFIRSFQEKAEGMQIGALMVVPYGEAMIHRWYWEGLAQLSTLAQLDAVGIQTNLSFGVREFADCFARTGGAFAKLRLWATFHPEMTSVSDFAAKCRQLQEQGIQLCAGSVGVPQNLSLLRQLKQQLDGIYLWVNKMDGLRRAYTQEEREAFLEIDPYFERELMLLPANAALCQERLFVEADGKLHTCNISAVLRQTSWRDTIDSFPSPECSRKQCSCYLAYGGRADFMNQILFGPYPLFRIPRRPKAVFLDIEGTLLPSAAGDRVSDGVMEGLNALAREGVLLFFATTLPYEKAMERCRRIRHLFAGGIFAGGAHLVLESGGDLREFFYEIDDSWVTALSVLEKKFAFRLLAYRSQGKLYKVTLLRPRHNPWDRQQTETVMDCLSLDMAAIRYFTEKNCLQIVSRDADKRGGVEELCNWLGISPKETAAAGDSGEDEGMLVLTNSVTLDDDMLNRGAGR